VGLKAELVVVGSGRLAGSLDAPGVRRLGAMADRAELEALYAGALALVMPSWAEGYGWPPLEAAACGTPSVVSDLPATRETLGDAALRVPPGDEAALAAALLRIVSDEALRSTLAADAAAAVEGRTWAAAASATHEVLEQARGV
jgi:glycosyltransferase involved in cell wall biosynthesis